MGSQFQLAFPGMPQPEARPAGKPDKATKRSWSGPIPGQTVMHPRDLGHQNHGITSHEWDMGEDATSTEKRHLAADPHGFIQQTTSNLEPDPDARTASLFSSHGGAVNTPSVREFWDRQPVHSVKADTPLHSTQSHTDTEHDGGVDDIKKDLDAGGRIQNPAWIVKDRGRLFVLDGHHRIAAARRAGRSDFPARVWDRDKAMGQ